MFYIWLTDERLNYETQKAASFEAASSLHGPSVGDVPAAPAASRPNNIVLVATLDKMTRPFVRPSVHPSLRPLVGHALALERSD